MDIPMRPSDYYIKAFQHYADFEGRARRSEYWYFVLFHMLATIVCFIPMILSRVFIFIPFVYMLAAIIPSIALVVRRLHDTNKSGWLYLVAFIPLGGIVIFVFMCLEGDHGENDYGPDPKEDEYYESSY